MFKKKKALILIGAAFILVMLALNFNMVSPGKRIITLKSYDTPQQAFYMQVSAAAVPIEKDLDLVPVDATNALYAAVTEKGDVVAAHMWLKGDRYYYPGSFLIVSGEALRAGEQAEIREGFLYAGNGKCSGSFSFTLSLSAPEDGRNAQKLYGAGDLGTVYLIWETGPVES